MLSRFFLTAFNIYKFPAFYLAYIIMSAVLFECNFPRAERTFTISLRSASLNFHLNVHWKFYSNLRSSRGIVWNWTEIRIDCRVQLTFQTAALLQVLLVVSCSKFSYQVDTHKCIWSKFVKLSAVGNLLAFPSDFSPGCFNRKSWRMCTFCECVEAAISQKKKNETKLVMQHLRLYATDPNWFTLCSFL